MERLSSTENLKIVLPLEKIIVLCQKYGVKELSVFGSVLRDDFCPDSDVDLLVLFENDDYGPWMSKIMDLEMELSDLLGHKVDLVIKKGVEKSENYIRRRHILSTARLIYAA
jgi:hypothetical protein